MRVRNRPVKLLPAMDLNNGKRRPKNAQTACHFTRRGMTQLKLPVTVLRVSSSHE